MSKSLAWNAILLALLLATSGSNFLPLTAAEEALEADGAGEEVMDKREAEFSTAALEDEELDEEELDDFLDLDEGGGLAKREAADEAAGEEFEEEFTDWDDAGGIDKRDTDGDYDEDEDDNEYDYDDDDDDDDDDDYDDDDDDIGDLGKRSVEGESFDAEDDDFDLEDYLDDDLQDNNNIISKRQAAGRAGVAGAPGRAPPPPRAPPDTLKQARRVSFDYSVNADSRFRFNASDAGARFADGSKDDEDNSRWAIVSSSGYEFQGSSKALRAVFASARLRFKASSASAFSRANGIYASGNPSGEGRSSSGIAGLLQRRSVFSPDTRVKVTSPHKFPWKAMGRVASGCTGTFIGPHHVLTAGHCVFSRKTKKWFKNLDVRRRKNCDPHKGVLHKWKWAITVKGWKKYGWKSYDYAIIVVHKSSPTYMSFGWRKPIPKYTINIAGYPGDKSKRCMWRSTCKIRNRFSKQLGYRCDTYKGMSGSAVYAYWSKSNKRIIYCVHAYGRSSARNYNKCTRITKSRFNQLKSWIKKYK